MPEKTDIYKKEFYFKETDKLPSYTEWIAKGKPKLWIKRYKKDKIIIYEDYARNHIQLITEQGKNIGKDIAIVGDYVAFGSYFSDRLNINKPYKILN